MEITVVFLGWFDLGYWEIWVATFKASETQPKSIWTLEVVKSVIVGNVSG